MAKIVKIIIGATIAIILLATILVPTINDANEGFTNTFTNTHSSNPPLKVVHDPDVTSFTIEYTPGNAYVSIGTTQFTISAYDGSMFWCDKGYVLLSTNSSLADYYYGRVVCSTGSIAGTSATTKLTVTCSGDDVTVTRVAADPDDNVVYTWSDCDWIAYPDANGTHTTYQKNGGAFKVNSINDILGCMYVSTGSTGLVSFEGSTAKTTGSTTYTMVLEATQTAGYDDLYDVASGAKYHIDTAELKNADDTPIIPFNYLIPISVTATTVVNDGIISIMAVIPVMIIMAIILSVVGVVFLKRE